MQVYIKIFIIFLVASCARTKHEGVILDDSEVSKLKIGLSEAEVRAILGSPSIDIPETKTESQAFIYVSSEKKWYAFFTPTVEAQRVIEVQFKNNIASSISIYGKDDIKPDSNFSTKIKNYKKP